MNNGIKLIFGAAAAGLIYTFLNKKKAALEDIKISNIDAYIDLEKTKQNFFLKLFYNLKIQLYNNADVSVKIKGIEAKFFINGIEFGSMNSTLKTDIAPKSSNKISLAASVSTGNIISSILDIISEGKATIKVEGTLLTDLGLVEFKEEKIV